MTSFALRPPAAFLRAAREPASHCAHAGAKLGAAWLRGPRRPAACSARPSAKRNVVTAAALHDVGAPDPDLHGVLDLCSQEELEELYTLLHSRSLLGPLVKSWVLADTAAEDEARGPVTREQLARAIEARFRFLAADSMSTLRGKLPTYRQTLLRIWSRLEIPCSAQLATEDLEAEIFLHLLQRHTEAVDVDTAKVSAAAASQPSMSADGMAAAARSNAGSLNPLRAVQRLVAPLTLGKQEVLPALAKLSGAGLATAARNSLLRQLGGAVVAQQVQAQAARSLVVSAGSRGVSASLQGRVAVEAARQGLARAAGRYAAARGILSMLGPLLAVSTAVELSMLSIGTDYGRIVQVVFALAQIRLLRTWGWQEGNKLAATGPEDAAAAAAAAKRGHGAAQRPAGEA